MRLKIELSLNNWRSPIPTELQQKFLAYLYQTNVPFLRQFMIICTITYCLYTIADWYIVPDLAFKSLLSSLFTLLVLLPLALLLLSKIRNILLVELILPVCILISTVYWGEMMKESESEFIHAYLYDSVVYVFLLFVGIRARFSAALVMSALLTTIVFYYVLILHHHVFKEVLIYFLIYTPILFFSAFICWHNLLNGRRLFLHSVVEEMDKAELHEANKKLWTQSRTDALTGIHNRSLFDDRTQQAILQARRDKYGLALMYIDLDHFKPINDTYGHAVGDLVLIEAAQRMVNSVRESDTVARIGGDEFVVLLPSINDYQAAVAVAEKIRSALEQPFELGGTQLRIGSSIGVAVYPEHGTNQDILAKNGDAALYRAKALGRNRVEMAVA
jgi:diguanylate cyclase (GGDEF)-like protein